MRLRLLTIELATTALLFASPGRAAPPDGGPGGACLEDADCGVCGWVCSVSRGNICIPAREGDPGQCHGPRGCLCPGQTCTASICTPAANPACWCNGDCDGGQVCDQLLFTCHPPSALYCGQPYDGYAYGPQTTGPACGCNGICGGSSSAPVCEAQGSSIPPECSSDMDCGACYQGWLCLNGYCAPIGDAGWCSDSRDLSPSFTQVTGPTMPRDGGTTADGGTASNEAKSSGCGTAGGDGPAALALLSLVFFAGLRRGHGRSY